MLLRVSAVIGASPDVVSSHFKWAQLSETLKRIDPYHESVYLFNSALKNVLIVNKVGCRLSQR